MPIKVTCECGKRFQAKDEYEGRRAICPSCRREFVFQARGVPAFIELPDPPPLPLIRTEEDEPGQDGSTEVSRPFWKDPIVVIGAAIPTLILAIFFTYLAWPRVRGTVDRNSSASNKTIQPNNPPAVNSGTLPTPVAASPSIAYKLAVIEAGHALEPNDPVVVLVDKLLKEADRFFVEDEATIAGMALSMHDAVKKANGLSSLVEILEGSTRWQQPAYFYIFKAKFSEYRALYVTFRVGVKQSHRDAIESIRYACRGVSLPDESLTDDAFSDLLKNATPGQRLAIVEARRSVPPEDPWVGRYQALLEDAATVFPQSASEVADLTLVAYVKLREVGKDPFPDDLIGGAINWARSRPDLTSKLNTTRFAYAFFLQRYIELRTNTNMLHDSAVRQIINSP